MSTLDVLVAATLIWAFVIALPVLCRLYWKYLAWFEKNFGKERK